MSDRLLRESDVIEAVTQYISSDYSTEEMAREDAELLIGQIPSADRPQGEWKRRLVDNGFNADWVCSECGYRVKTDFVSFNFCPNCGADMRGDNDGKDIQSADE